MEDFENGVMILTKILESHPDDIITLTRMGQLSLKANRISDALVYFNKIRNIDPENEIGVQYLKKLEPRHIASDETEILFQKMLEAKQNNNDQQVKNLIQQIILKSKKKIQGS